MLDGGACSSGAAIIGALSSGGRGGGIGNVSSTSGTARAGGIGTTSGRRAVTVGGTVGSAGMLLEKGEDGEPSRFVSDPPSGGAFAAGSQPGSMIIGPKSATDICGAGS